MASPILVLAGGALVLAVVFAVVTWARETRATGAKPSRVCIEAGDSHPLVVVLAHKPRWTYDWRAVGGQATFRRQVNAFTVGGRPATTFTVALNTVTQRHEDAIVGVQPGAGVLDVDGLAASGDGHDPAKVDVLVVQPSANFLAVFTQAAHHWNGSWRHGTMGNLLGGVKCDAWADWMVDWVKRHSRGRVCKVEKVVWHGRMPWGLSRHVCVRITLCDPPEVHYLDPWRFGPEKGSWMEKDAYEKMMGSPPDEAWAY